VATSSSSSTPPAATRACGGRQLETLGAEHSAVALDLPGHGRSCGVDGLASIEEYATLVERFAAALALRPCVLVGRSMGGAIGLVMAARQPALLCGLVLACTTARFDFPAEALTQAHDVVRGRLPQQFGTDTFSRRRRRRSWSRPGASR
jgi:pimeloyl-ACP methyl ester carboxylesterase